MTKPDWTTVLLAIRDEIERGHFRPGDRLPPTARLCETYGVSAIVVRNALLGLKAQGVVTAVPGVGVFVGDRPADVPRPDGPAPDVPRQRAPRRRGCTWKTAHRRPKRR